MNTVWVSCEGENPDDVENIGPIQYYPTHGFPGFYFPYKNLDVHLSPIVAVWFKRPTILQGDLRRVPVRNPPLGIMPMLMAMVAIAVVIEATAYFLFRGVIKQVFKKALNRSPLRSPKRKESPKPFPSTGVPNKGKRASCGLHGTISDHCDSTIEWRRLTNAN